MFILTPASDAVDIMLQITDKEELIRTMQSLACGKKKVMKKRPAGKDVNDTDVFYFNAEFTDPKHIVHISSVQAKETVRFDNIITSFSSSDQLAFTRISPKNLKRHRPASIATASTT